MDNGLYALFHWLFLFFFGDTAVAFRGIALTSICAFGARIFSSLFNFYMNKYLVFGTQVDTRMALVRYYALAIPQLLAQILLTQGVYWLFLIPETALFLRTLIYAIVMTVLYIASYMIQQRWVFAPDARDHNK